MSSITFTEYVNGTETERLEFERANGGDLYEHRRVYTPWPTDKAESEARIARQLLAGDEWHRSGGCRRGTSDERMLCETCALLGYEPRGGWGNGFNVSTDGPNYAGWPRIYIEAKRPIPAKWREAFAAEVTDNPRYMEALGRDLVTFGHPGFTD